MTAQHTRHIGRICVGVRSTTRRLPRTGVRIPPRTPHGGIPATSDVSVFKCALPRRTTRLRPVGVAPRRGVSAVTAAVIAPVVPSASQNRDRNGAPGGVPLSRRPLPLPGPIAQRTTAYVYGQAALDDRGQLADRVVMHWAVHRGFASISAKPAGCWSSMPTRAASVRSPAKATSGYRSPTPQVRSTDR